MHVQDNLLILRVCIYEQKIAIVLSIYERHIANGLLVFLLSLLLG